MAFLRVTCRSTISPGTTKGTKITTSFTLAIALPSAAMSVIVIFSKMGSGFLFLAIKVEHFKLFQAAKLVIFIDIARNALLSSMRNLNRCVCLCIVNKFIELFLVCFGL